MARSQLHARKAAGGSAPRATLKLPPATFQPVTRGHLNRLPGSEKNKEQRLQDVARTVLAVPVCPARPSRTPVICLPSRGSSVENLFCHLCQDGGELWNCDGCPRVICTRCVLVPEDCLVMVRAPDVVFRCVSCHWLLNATCGEPTPYYGFYRDECPVLPSHPSIRGRIELSMKSEIRSAPTLILNFRLKTMPPGGPVEMLRQFLIPYYPGGGFKFMDIEFDMGTTVKQKEYATKALQLAATIEQEYRNVLVVITDHTDQDSGDLFIGEKRGKPIAGEVYEFMTCLLSPFERAIRGGTLVMLACGSIVRQTASFEALQDAVVRFGFSASIAFDAEHLQLAVTSSFLLNIIEATLIEGHDIRAAFPEALGYLYHLGMHSNVLLLTCDQDSPRIVTKDEDGQLAY